MIDSGVRSLLFSIRGGSGGGGGVLIEVHNVHPWMDRSMCVAVESSAVHFKQGHSRAGWREERDTAVYPSTPTPRLPPQCSAAQCTGMRAE